MPSPSFRSPASQANFMKAELHKSGTVKSVDTSNTYASCLRVFAKYAQENRHSLKTAPTDLAKKFLEQKATQVSQKTLDKYRQAINANSKYHKSGDQIQKKEVPKAGKPPGKSQEPRAYTQNQLDRIQSRMKEKHQVALKISRETGIRAREAATIAKPHEQPPDKRDWRDDRFRFREGHTEKYTVKGKGGLYREVRLSPQLARELEQFRRPEAVTVQDRGADLQSRYDIGYGQALSNSFSHHSRQEVGWSEGFHGVRHTYAQERMEELQRGGYTQEEAKLVVSQELGHFSTSNTERYIK